MLKNNFIKRWYIKICRYLFGQKYLRVMAGPLKGYLWTTTSSYEYILGNYEDPETMNSFLSWLKDDTVYYDIGSNICFYALTANQVINTGKIYAFEPMPAIREIFENSTCPSLFKMATGNSFILLLKISLLSQEFMAAN